MQIKPLTVADIPALLAIETVANRYPWTEGVFKSCFGSQYFNFGLFENDKLLGFLPSKLSYLISVSVSVNKVKGLVVNCLAILLQSLNNEMPQKPGWK